MYFTMSVPLQSYAEINKVWQDIPTDYLGSFTIQPTLLTGKGKITLLFTHWTEKSTVRHGMSLRGY